jgi:DNA-binding SARP family transcriptional activator
VTAPIVTLGGWGYLGRTLAAEQGTRIQLCGRFVARVEGQRVESAMPGPQGRLLFALLAVNRHREIPRDEAIDSLWGESAPSAPGIALSALLSKLRNAVGADLIEGKTELRLVLPAGAWIDVEAALEGAHRAESAVAAQDWCRAYGPASVALHIAERGFLPGLQAPWVDDWRTRLEDVLVRAHECIGITELALGGSEIPLAEGHARELIRMAPFRESGYALLMEALERRGNVAEALLVHDRLRCLLRDELGIAPGPGVQALHERLLRQGAGVTPMA